MKAFLKPSSHTLSKSLHNFLFTLLLVFLAYSITHANGADAAALDAETTSQTLPLETTRRLQLNATEGTWISLDVSPDGKTIVFELLGDLYTLPISGGVATRITFGQSFDQQPRYSPDGSKIAFVSDRSGADNLWVINADGTEPKAITNDSRHLFISPEWTPEGDYIVVSKNTDVVNRPQNSHLFMYHVDGGTGIQLTGGEPIPGGEHDYRVQAHLGAAFSPNGKTLYMSAGSRGYGNWQLAELDRATGRIFQRSHEAQSAMRPVVSPDGRYLVYATRRDGKTALKLIELAGGDERWLVPKVDRDEQETLPSRDLLPGASFTPDSKALIVAYGGKIHKVAIATGSATVIPFQAQVDVPMGPNARFDYPLETGPVTARRLEHPALSPNGEQAAFVAFDKIWVQDLSNGKSRALADTGTDQFFPAWSPDGKWLAFATWDDLEGGDIYKVRANGGKPIRLTRRKGFYERLAFSPDGERIVAGRGPRSQRITFFDELERGRPQSTELVWLPSDGGDATMITRLNVAKRWAYPHHGKPHFGKNSSQIYFFDPLDGLVAVRWDGSERKQVVDVKSWEWTYNPQVPADEVLLSPAGDRALVLANSQVYLIEVPAGTAGIPSISLTNQSNAALPIRQLTSVGADYIGWTREGKAFWALGKTITVSELTNASPATYTANVTRPRDMPRGVIALRGARVITMNGKQVIENADLVVTDNRITGLGARGMVQIPTGAEVLDVSGKTIIPGFVDIHSHMWAPWGVHRRQVWEYLANLAYGVTATRDPQTMTPDVITYSDRVAAGEILGPRIYTTARGVFASEDFRSIDDARNALTRYSQHFRTETIKNYLVGDRIHRQWLIQAANEQKLSSTAEGTGDFKLNMTFALDGYAGQEHSWTVFPLYEDTVQLFAQSGMTYTPTLIINLSGPSAENFYFNQFDVHDDPKLRRFIPHKELDRRTLRRSVAPHDSQWIFREVSAQANKVLAAGGSVALGAHGQLQGMGVHWEAWLMASGGMSNHDALRVATLEGAKAIGHSADFGSIEIGKLADLQILNDNPLENIRNTLSIQNVMINGRLYNANTMNQVWPEKRELPMQWWWSDEHSGQSGTEAGN